MEHRASVDPTVETRWTEPLLEERCRILRDTLRSRGEPEAALAALAPGGAENHTPDPLGARIVWYALLRGRLAVLDAQRAQEEAAAQTALAAALTNEPVPVALSVGAKAVYPKSFHALCWCDALDRALDGLADKVARAVDLEVTVQAPVLASLAVRLWAWILTCPEPGLPFREGEPDDPPAWTERLTAEDLLALLEAHYTVNRARIALVASLFPGERAEASRLSLSGFLGTVAQELHHRPSDVLRRWTLGEAFAQAVVAAEATREAKARAERETPARAGAA